MHDQRTGLCECGCGVKTAISTYTARRDGYVKGEPRRFLTGHATRSAPRDYEVRDCGYETPCWVWQLYVDAGGYGRKTGPRHTTTHAHVFHYEQAHGPVPEGLELDHLCRNRACCNPDHLEPVTTAVNARRGSNAKLTAEDVREIRAQRGRESGAALALRFGIHRSTVSEIQLYQRWRDVV